MALIRYPGSKKKLVAAIRKTFPDITIGQLFSLDDRIEYREPFFGAGAVGFSVMENLPSHVSVWINDIDPGIVAMWKSVLEAPEELSRLIAGFEPTVEAFYRFKEEDGAQGMDPVRTGFQKLALHQMSMSGFGAMSGGPLGGRNQNKSTYRVDCRWNPERLVLCVQNLHSQMSRFRRMKITQGSYEKLLADTHPLCFIYLDPPYVEKGPELYKFSMKDRHHSELAERLQGVAAPWVLSYDDHELIRTLYQEWCEIEAVDITYSNAVSKGKRPKNREIVIRPKQHCAVRRAAGSPDTGSVLPVGRPPKKPPPEGGDGNGYSDGKFPNFGNLDQSKRGSRSGVSHYTQWKLDKLARDRPDLLQAVQHGRLSADAAYRQLMDKLPNVSVPKDPCKAAVVLARHFDPTQLRVLADALSRLADSDDTDRSP